jgi:uncharacterized protein YndB with AHSA1/START domain
MSIIKQTYMIAAPPEDVWRALTDPRIIQEWSGAAAEFPLQVGAAYSLWDGSIGGEILEVVPGERLVQTWKPVDWTRQDSFVRFILVPEEGTTRVDLVHENVEEADYEGTDEGWDIYYLGAIKRLLEAPAPKKRAAPKKKTAPKKKAAAKKARSAKKTVARKKSVAPKKKSK